MNYPDVHGNYNSETTYKVVTICGSMRFFNRMLEAAQAFTSDGYIVLMPFVVKRPGVVMSNEMLDDMHKRKIDMSDSIFVVNEGGYVGESTASEIAYARARDVEVKWFDWILQDFHS